MAWSNVRAHLTGLILNHAEIGEQSSRYVEQVLAEKLGDEYFKINRQMRDNGAIASLRDYCAACSWADLKEVCRELGYDEKTIGGQ